MGLVQIIKKERLSFAYEGIQTMSFTALVDLDLSKLPNFDAVILDFSDARTVREILKRIRTFDAENVYLTPVYILSSEKKIDESILALADGVLDEVNEKKLRPLITGINEKIKTLEPFHTDSYELRIAVKILRHLYTREKTLDPIIDTTSMLGYSYPVIAVNFKDREEHKVFDIIAFAERERLLEGTFVDRINLCSKCYAAFLNFREVCEKCKSSNLLVEDLIHHFTCAYVGPESDFVKGDLLLCPKCDKQIKHIGVDYDKPSAIYTCNSCKETSQNAIVKAFCFYCREDMPVENLVQKDIRSYTLSTKGDYAAVYGTSISMKEIIKLQGMVEFDIFKKIFTYELERMKRVKREGCISYLQFLNFQDLYLLGAKKDTIFAEIVKLIKDSLRPSDVLSYLNESTLLFFFTDTSASAASIPVERLRSNLIKLVKDNFKGFEPRVNTDIINMNSNLDLEEFLKTLPTE